MYRTARNLVSRVRVLGPLLMPVGAIAQTPIADLQIAPSQVELQIGERKTLLVTAYDGTGNVVPNARFEWSVQERVIRVQHDPSAPNLLYLDAVGYGVTAITVRTGTISADVQVRVANAAAGAGSGPATSIRFQTGLVHLFPTEQRQIAPRFLRADGLPASAQRVQWRSQSPALVKVDGDGMIIGVATGRGIVEVAAASGLTARLAVEVSHATLGFLQPSLEMTPSTVDTIRVIVPDHENRQVANERFVWTSTAPQVVTVSPLGVVSAVGVGSGEIVATGFGQQHRLPITVRQAAEFPR